MGPSQAWLFVSGFAIITLLLRHNICSMLMDVRRGCRTEIDIINGFIVAEAEKLGLDAPINKQMQALIHALHCPEQHKPKNAGKIPVVASVKEMREMRRQFKGRVGFVPTMGGLHEGHLRLIKACREHGCDHVVVSIFVNGSQFGPNEDFDKYPRNHEKDIATLQQNAPVDAVFSPRAEEIYPNDPRGLNLRTRIEPLDVLSEPEALARPGFFGGVATVCASLFNIVQPDIAVFGQKDALQCAVIQNLVEDLHIPVKIIVAETVRETSGLAKSTRNKYLTENLAQQAPAIPEALHRAAAHLRSHGSLQDSKNLAQKALLAESHVSEVEYVSIADRRTGRELSTIDTTMEDKEAVISCAIQMQDAGAQVRLIDNVCVRL